MKSATKLKKFIISFLFFIIHSISTFASTECIQAYKLKTQRSSDIQEKYGIIPEFLNTQILLLSYMGSGSFFPKMHQSIIKNLPENIKAFTVMPTATEKINSKVYSHSLKYKEDMKDFISSGRLKLIEVPVNEDFVLGEHVNWIRDFMSPAALAPDGKIKFINATYFDPLADHTDQVIREKLSQEIKKLASIDIVEAKLPFVFEWGNWENDGLGNIFVSEVLLRSNRDVPSFSSLNYDDMKNEFTLWFSKHINPSIKINWIKPLPLEPTGHIDLMFKFVNEKEVILASSPNRYDQEQLMKARTYLESLGKKIYTIEVAVADIEKFDGRIPFAPFRSYTNSLIVRDEKNNTAIAFVPKYADETYPELATYDKRAQELYEVLGFKVVMVPSGEAITKEGAVHCATCTIPIFNTKGNQ